MPYNMGIIAGNVRLCNDTTKTEDVALIQSHQMDIFRNRETTRGNHEMDLLFIAVIMKDKASRLINQWKNDMNIDREELLDIANYAVIGCLLLDGNWYKEW